MIGYREALRRTLKAIAPLPAEEVGLLDSLGRVSAERVKAEIFSPSIAVSLKDGYAVRSNDVHMASSSNPIRLRLMGQAVAGEAWEGIVKPGMAVRILTGAAIPQGANAVLSEEFARLEGEEVLAMACAEEGRNIMPRGAEVQKGHILARKGWPMMPETLGLLAAAGIDRLRVVRRPRVGILGTGDEIIAPGTPLKQGGIYASNLVALAGWCLAFGMRVSTDVSPDRGRELRIALERMLPDHDAILTSGGAWKGERDLIAHVLGEMGWTKIYHGVRMGPGKAVAFGLLRGRTIICLPGGPPSNQMAFLQLALPGLLKLGGHAHPKLPVLPVRLTRSLRGPAGWTQFIYGSLHEGDECLLFDALEMRSRLKMMSKASAVVSIPEGRDHLPQGSVQEAQLLTALPACFAGI